MTDITQNNNKEINKVGTMIKISLLGAMAAVLMVIFKFPLPFAPPYMTVDFGDVPVLVAGFALGPISGVITAFLKILLSLLLNGTTTGYVGELSNFILASSFVLVASLIYNFKKTFTTAILGIIAGGIVMTIIATLTNFYIIFPMYGVPVESFKALASFVVPFNLAKSGLVGLVTVLLYKPISRIFKKF